VTLFINNIISNTTRFADDGVVRIGFLTSDSVGTRHNVIFQREREAATGVLGVLEISL
jgi:hypothetical protein